MNCTTKTFLSIFKAEMVLDAVYKLSSKRNERKMDSIIKQIK